MQVHCSQEGHLLLASVIFEMQNQLSDSKKVVTLNKIILWQLLLSLWYYFL